MNRLAWVCLRAGILAVSAGAVVLGCVRSEDDAGKDARGQVLISFTVPDGVDNQVAMYWVTKDGATLSAGEADAGADGLGAIFLTELAPANGYRIWLTVERVGGPACMGSLPFAIVASQTEALPLPLECADLVSEGNTGFGDETFNYCPQVTSISASSTIAAVGSSVEVTVAAGDRDQDPLSFVWSARSGVLETPTASSTTYKCTQEGTDILIVAISDGPARGCTRNGQLGILCTGSAATLDALDAGH